MKTLILTILVSISICQKWTQIIFNVPPTPSPRTTVTLYQAIENKIIVYGGVGPGIVYNDLWQYDVVTSKWVGLNVSGAPSPRDSGVVQISSNNEIFILGGFVSGTAQLEAWKFNMASVTWTQLSSAPVRVGVPSVYDESQQQILILLDLAVVSYNVQSNSWQTLQLANPRPSNRNWTSVALLKRTREVFMFGGYAGNLLRKYSIDTNTWTQILKTNPWPSPRYRHCMQISSQEELVIFGGYDSVNFLADTWVFNIASSVWRRLTSLEFFRPSARMSPACQLTKNDEFIVMFGMRSAVEYLNDVWMFSLYNGTSPRQVASSVVSSVVGSQSSPASYGTSTSSDQIVSDEIVESNSQSSSSSKTNQNNKELVSTTILDSTRLIIYIVGGAVLLIVIACQRRSRKKQSEEEENSNATTTTMTNYTTTTNNSDSTLMTTSFGLSIPGYLLQKYGVNLRPVKEIARGGFGKVYVGEVLDMKGFQVGTKIVIKTLLASNQGLTQKHLDVFYQEVQSWSY